MSYCLRDALIVECKLRLAGVLWMRRRTVLLQDFPQLANLVMSHKDISSPSRRHWATCDLLRPEIISPRSCRYGTPIALNRNLLLQFNKGRNRTPISPARIELFPAWTGSRR